MPIDGDKRLIERAEAAIAKMLYQQKGVVGSFQDPDVIYRPRRSAEQPLEVKVNFPKGLMGLSQDLII